MPPLQPLSIPGLFVTATDTEVGKTVVAGAIANWFARRQRRVAVCKPAATGCRRTLQGLVSEDAEILAACADSSFSLDLICPQRYAEPLAPAVAAERAAKPIDWAMIQLAISEMAAHSEVMIVEGVGGVCVPMDHNFALIDVIQWLKIPAVVVARPGLGTINHTLLTVMALRAAQIPVAGIIINRYPAESASIAEETNLRVIETWAKAPVLAVVPDERFTPPKLPPGIVAAIDRVDWSGVTANRVF